MKIWESYQPLSTALSILNNKNCWSSCHGCKKKWNKTGTVNVHMLVFEMTGGVATRFSCDSCLDGFKSKANSKVIEMSNQE